MEPNAAKFAVEREQRLQEKADLLDRGSSENLAGAAKAEGAAAAESGKLTLADNPYSRVNQLAQRAWWNCGFKGIEPAR